MKNIFFALISVLLISCKSNNDLQGNEYQTIGDAGLEITLSFSDKNNDFHGQAINNYFGSYHAKNGKNKTFDHRHNNDGGTNAAYGC